MRPHDNDPYYSVAVVFTIFMCDDCHMTLPGDDESGESYGPGDDCYYRFGQYAKRLGWYAVDISVPGVHEDWRVLCPACAAAKKTHVEPNVAPDCGGIT